MFFHPDPRDRDGMLEFAVREGRQGELKVIEGVVGKDLSKHQRKKKMKDGYVCLYVSVFSSVSEKLEEYR